jgi:hypothetical protein
MKPKRIAIGSDHAGYEAKELAKGELAALKLEVLDKGADSLDSVDYPDFGAAVGRAVASGEVERGVVICGSGIGISIAANKVPGVQRRQRPLLRRAFYRTGAGRPHGSRLHGDGVRGRASRAAR